MVGAPHAEDARFVRGGVVRGAMGDFGVKPVNVKYLWQAEHAENDERFAHVSLVASMNTNIRSWLAKCSMADFWPADRTNGAGDRTATLLLAMNSFTEERSVIHPCLTSFRSFIHY